MADRIEQQILNAEKAIERLTERINNLKAQLESGDWGTQQIKEMQVQMDKLSASLEKKVTRKQTLIDQKDIQEAEALAKTIDTLKAKIESLNQTRATLATQGATGSSEFIKVEKDISNAERALKSFQSRLASRNLQPSGSYEFNPNVNPITGREPAPGTKGSNTLPIETPNKDEIERRLNNSVLGMPLTNAEVQSQVAKAREIAAEFLKSNQGGLGAETQNTQTFGNAQRLEEVNAAIKETIALLRQLKEQSVTTRGGIVSDDEIAQEQKLNSLWEERRRLRSDPVFRAQTRLQGGAATEEAPSFKVDPTKLTPEARKIYEEAAKAAEQASKSTRGLGNEEEKESEKAKKARLEQERLAKARMDAVSSSPRYIQALQQAQKQGLGLNDLKKIEDRGGGVQQLLFQKQDGGISKNFRTYVDETGKATAGLSSQFRSFGSDIIRDIGQFTKWSIAIAAVYTPMQKLGELITVMIDNESRLADATIAANEPFSKAGEIFDTVAVSADKMGESINTTIDAYTSAIRAAGRLSDESAKQVAAIKLLNDSLILSKLSTLNQADAIDTLSAALIQSDRSLTGGTELLNKWVKVSQIANVDITALATGVAVLGDSAETVGLSIDQLNGLIAVLSENSISGAKEAANTAKALVGAYQSDKAEAALNKYGVALRKTNGEVRSFLDIYQQLSSLRAQGVLSEANISELSLALGGGGVRRAKDASALINNTERLNSIAAESAKITGQDTLAQDALSKKLETVQTANTRLANSFQELAQTLGDKGGLLDYFKELINLLTAVTKGATELFGLLGRSGPLLATFSAGILAINGISSGRRDTLLATLGAKSAFNIATSKFEGPLQNTPEMGYGKSLIADILRLNTRGGLILGGAGVAAQAGVNLSQNKNENAVANVIGGAIGAAIGGSLGGPVGIAAGANIGSAIGDAFVTGVEKHSDQLADYFVPKRVVNTNAPQQAPTQETYRGKTTSELLDTAYNSLTFFQKIQAYLNQREAKQTSGGLLGGTFESYGTKESAAMDIVKRVNPALYQALQQQYTAQQAALAPSTNLKNIQNSQQYADQRAALEQQAVQARREQLLRLSSGQITSADYGRITNQISGFPAQAIQSVEAYGKAFQDISKDVNSTKDAYDAFLYIATNGTQDQINLLSQYSNDINTLQEVLSGFGEQTIGTKLQLSFGDVTIESKEQLQKLIADLQQQGGTAAEATYTQIRLNQIKLPGIVGSATQATSSNDINLIKQQASKLQEQFYTDMNLTDDEIVNLKSKLEDFAVLVGDAAKNHYDTISGIDQKFWDAAQKLLEDQGKIKPQNNGIGFQQFDVPMAQLQQLAAQSLQIGGSWQQQYNYDFKPEDQIAIDNQGIVSPLHADFKILALLLQDLNDKAQKQLDGQYNIPEGATFWVPLTAAYYRNKDTGGSNLQNLLDSLTVDQNTSATDQNTRALDDLTGVLSTSPETQQFIATEQRNAAEKNAALQPKVTPDIQAMIDAEVRNRNTQALTAPYGPPAPTYGPPAPSQAQTAQQTGIAQLINDLRNFFGSLFQGNGAGGYYKPSGGISNPQGGLTAPTGSIGSRSNTALNTTPATTIRLDLKSSANVNLLVDGRVLASTLQSYLASELIRADQTQSTITRRFIA